MVEGTITRNLNEVFDGFNHNLMSFCDRSVFESKIKQLKMANGNSACHSIRAELRDMFTACGIEWSENWSDEDYENAVKESKLPEVEDVETEMVRYIYSIFKEYPMPEEYMIRMVNRLSKDIEWKNDSLRVRILKQFIKYGEYLEAAGYKGKDYIRKYAADKLQKKECSMEEILDGLDDKVFDVLEQKGTTKDDRKPDGKYGLLKLTDDLAGGKFRTNGSTKKGLYLFAMVYGMTYDYQGTGEGIVYESDIEKNLFRDYYTNNLMRFLSEGYKKRGNYERDPSGQGINYKNFAEIVYLYFIVSDYPAAEKIRRSAAMIQRLKDTQNAMEEEKGIFHVKRNATVFFKFQSEKIFEMSETDFEEFIFLNYNCQTDVGDNKLGPLQMEAEQNTAFRVYKELLEKIEEEQGMPLQYCNYGFRFNKMDITRMKKKGVLGDKEDAKTFEQLIDAMNDYLGLREVRSNKEIENEIQLLDNRQIKALSVKEPKAMTRTSLVVAYYYYYDLVHAEDGKKTFGEVYGEFKSEIDDLLEEAYYQPFDKKNIFDVFVAFSSYANLIWANTQEE